MKNISYLLFLFVYFFIYPVFSDSKYNLKPIELASGVYVILGDNSRLSSSNGGAISNTGFIVGDASILVIDAGPSALYAEEVIRAIENISTLPIKYIVITHHHPDHSFGISKYNELGVEIIINTSEIIRYEKYGHRLLRQMVNLVGEEWFENTKIISIARKEYDFPYKIDLGNKEIEINYFKNGHSEGDLIVVDYNEEIVFSGDLVFNERAPTIPHANIENWIIYIDKLIKSKWLYLVPGHGPVIDKKDQLNMTKNWINYLNNVAIEAVNKGLSPAEVYEQGIAEEYKKYKLYKEVWYRDLPLLMKKYENE